jgi:hypothetical protein
MRAASGVVAVLAMVLGVAGCGDGSAAQETEQAVESGACGPVEEPQLQSGLHLLGGQEPPIPWSSTPPTSGWHAAGLPDVTVYDDPLPEAQQVSILETGAVVITYGDLPADDIAQLAALVAEDDLAGKVALTPYDRLGEGEVAIAAWGALRRCDAVDPVALRDFARTFASAPQTGDH